MKQTKRILALLLAAVMAFALCACGGSGGANGGTKPDGSAPAYTETTTADGWIKVTQDGPTLGYSSSSGVALLTIGGLAFKDHDKDGELDVYEDWRADPKDRAEDLASKLTIEQIAGLRYLAKDPGVSAETFEPDLNNFVRSFLGNQFQSSDLKLGVKALNKIQEMAETADFGVPVVPNMDPPGAYFGYSSQLGLAATFDPDIVQSVYAEGAKLMRSYGFFEMLGPQADTATEPRWSRAGSTFGEDPALVRDMTAAAVTGLQSTFAADGTDLGWGSDSVIAQVKHYPGDGPAEAGRESHNDSGKYNVYPGGAFAASLVSFFDGAFNLDSATEYAAAVMPSYSIAWSDNEEYGELVGSNFSAYKIGLLRENGYEGIVSTDSLIMPDNTAGVPTISVHGMDGKSSQEVIYQILTVGVDRILMPDFGEPVSYLSQIASSYDLMVQRLGQEEADLNFHNAAVRILTQYIKTGAFENPYSEYENAKATIEDSGVKNSFNEANQKGIVMLKNSGGAIKQYAGKPTVYIPLQANGSAPIDLDVAAQYFNVVTDTVGEGGSDEASGETSEDASAETSDEAGGDASAESASGEASGSASGGTVIRASAAELAACDFALVFLTGPRSGNVYDSATGTYLPVSLQYGEYTADGPNVRRESISQGAIQTEVETPYGPTFSVAVDNRSYYGQTAAANGTASLALLQEIAGLVPDSCPVVGCFNTAGSMVFAEVEPYCDSILVAFGVGSQNFLPILAGQMEPYGLLPVQMPADMDTVEAQYEDVPRDMTCYVDAAGNTYDFAFGMNWSGVINDQRVATYKVDPLLTPATIEFHLAK